MPSEYDEERNGGEAGRVYGCQLEVQLGVSNPGLQILGSNECDVSYQYGTRALFQYIRRIPALYYSLAKEALRQLKSCQPSSQNE